MPATGKDMRLTKDNMKVEGHKPLKNKRGRFDGTFTDELITITVDIDLKKMGTNNPEPATIGPDDITVIEWKDIAMRRILNDGKPSGTVESLPKIISFSRIVKFERPLGPTHIQVVNQVVNKS